MSETYQTYDEIPSEVFVEKTCEMVEKMVREQGSAWLMTIPDVYQAVAEHLVNSVLDELCPMPVTPEQALWQAAFYIAREKLADEPGGDHKQDRWQNWSMHMASALVKALAYLPVTPEQRAAKDYDEMMEWVLDLFEGVPYPVFKGLDENASYYGHTYDGEEWHWKLRRTRNHASEPTLFDMLDGGR